MDKGGANERQRAVFLCGVVLATAMWLYPPWRKTEMVFRGAWLYETSDAGYAPIFAPSRLAGPGQWGRGIDNGFLAFFARGPYWIAVFGGPGTDLWVNWSRLCRQWLGLVVLVAGGVYCFRDPAVSGISGRQSAIESAGQATRP